MSKDLFCHKCDDYKEIKVIEKKEIYPVKGEDIEVLALVSLCKDCDEELFNEELDGENLERAYDVYRKKHGLLSTNEIKKIREMYGLSQRSFSKLLRWGEISMNRYETGAIPDKAHNNLLLLLKNPINMLEIINSSEGSLSISQEKKLRERIESLQSETAITVLQQSILKTIGDRNDVFTGFKKFDFEKFKSLVVFFTCREKKLYKTKLMKLLWYADNLYFKFSTNSITGLQYAHLPRGPVIENRNILLSALEQSKIITMIEDEETGGEYVVSNCDFDDISLNEAELKVAEIIVNKFKSFNTKMISDYSHVEKGYTDTKVGSLISYEYAKYIGIAY